MTNLSSRPRVALLIETSLVYGREIHLGIADYVHVHGHWSIFVEQRELTTKPPLWLSRDHWDGIIARSTSDSFLKSIRKLDIPIVDLNDRQASFGLPRIRADDEAIGKLAAEHLLERGFRNFAFCSFQDEDWAERRARGFLNAIRSKGREVHQYESHWLGSRALHWNTDQNRLSKWISQLPRPLGIAACNDVRGQHVLESCRRLGLSVPEEVAVIGVDNDELMCQLADPPLSSISPNARRVGYLAAEMLHNLMRGLPVGTEDVLVPPTGVIARLSTDTLAIDDPIISRAVRYIRDNACRGIHVEDILREVQVSRSQLEVKFRSAIGRTPHAEIRKVQLQKVCQLLAETELPLKNIASITGFSHLEYLNYFFKRETTLTPGQYRRMNARRTSLPTAKAEPAASESGRPDIP